MILNNLLNIQSMVRSMKLVVLHRQRNESLAILDSLDNWSEVLLKLIV